MFEDVAGKATGLLVLGIFFLLMYTKYKKQNFKETIQDIKGLFGEKNE